MLLVIQIPCFNEEQTIGITLSQLPRELPGIDRVLWLVIDDGSADRTSVVAQAFGADHVLRMNRHRGLAAAFRLGLQRSLELGADIVVNTDADNQYDARDIPKLLAPLLSGQADMVVGTRPISRIHDWSPLKRGLHRFGNLGLGILSGVPIADATSGFRAFRREAALRLRVHGRYTYTLETILQAAYDGLAISTVPVGINPSLRPSRLIKNIPTYLWHSLITVARALATYRPVPFFLTLAMLVAITGMGLSTAAVFLSAGLLGELLATNRRILETLQARLTPELNPSELTLSTLDDEASAARSELL